MAATLSEYQCECAAPSAVQTPRTYKQGPVVRLDKDVREVQKWAGVDQGGSMNRESRTALRDKVAEYQRQNGIEAKTPGELNRDTLERMRQDKALPGGLVDSLEKVNPYYKPDSLPRITCATKPGEEANPAAKVEAPKADAPTGIIPPKAAEKPNLDKMGIVNHDVPPEKEAAFYADMSKKFAEMVQEKSGLPKTGKFDDTTIAKMKENPQFKLLAPQVDKWKEAGLIDRDGNWDQKRHAELRVESWGKPSEPVAKAAAPAADLRNPNDPRRVDRPQENAGITNVPPEEWHRKWAEQASKESPKGDNPLAGAKPSDSGTFMHLPYKPGVDPDPKTIRGPADMSGPQGTMMKMTAADSYTDGWQRFKAEYLSPSFARAEANPGPQSLEVAAREAKAAPAVDTVVVKAESRNQFSMS